MQVAGERLAFVLNEIIEHKRHKEAHAHGRGLPSRKVAVGTEKVAPKWASGKKHKKMDIHGFYRQIKLQEKKEVSEQLGMERIHCSSCRSFTPDCFALARKC